MTRARATTLARALTARLRWRHSALVGALHRIGLSGLLALSACSARGGGGGGATFDADGGVDDRVTPALDAPVGGDSSRADATSTDDLSPALDAPATPDTSVIPDVTAAPDVMASPDVMVSPDAPAMRCGAWSLSESATELTLPPGFPTESFRSYARYSSVCTSTPGLPVFYVTDVNGDGRHDILVTSRCADASASVRWQAYLGTATGFAATPRAMAVPEGFPVGTFADAYSGVQCTASPPRHGYLFTDYNDDRRPDVMMYSQCGDSSVGTTRWRLFPGTDAGWAAGVDLSLPSGYAAGAFASPLAAVTCADASRSHRFNAVMDLDGDRLPDITVYTACDDAAVGASHWRLHRNVRTGFAASATRWTLPTGYPLPFTAFVQGALRCPAQPVSYAVTDLDGDRRPDLVVYRTCDDATVGSTFWRVHRNTGAGFAQEPTRWQLPASYAPGAVDFFANGMDCAARQGVTAGLIDVNGDERVDLVVTTSCADSNVGRAYWNVHLNTGAGFAAEPARVTLPTGYAGAEFRFMSTVLQCSPLTFPWAYATGDIDGDRAFDLTFYASCSDARVGVSAWRAHRGQCM